MSDDREPWTNKDGSQAPVAPAGGCLMALAMLPALPVLALVRRRGPNAQCGCCGCRRWMCGCSCCCGR